MKKMILNFIGVCFVLIMVNLDVTIVNLALPSLGHYFHSHITALQWVMNGYLLATAVVFVVAGRLADHYGHKRMFFVGLALFLLGSIFSGSADHIAWLIFGRILQGFGVAFAFAQAIVLGVRGVGEKRRGKVLGLMVTLSGIAQALGPNLGGVIIDYYSWRWIFFLNIPLVVLSFIFVWYACRSDEPEEGRISLDFWSVSLFSGGILFLMYAITQVSAWGLQSASFYGFLVLGLLLLVGFYFKDNKSVAPLIGTETLRNIRYLSVCAARVLYMLGWGFILFALPLLLKIVFNKSSLQVGFLLLAMTGLFAVTSPLVGYLLDKYEAKKLVLIGWWIGLSALLVQFLFISEASIFWLTVSLLLYGICSGVITPSTPALALSSTRKNAHGTALSLFYALAFIGAAAGVGIGGGMWKLILLHKLVPFHSATVGSAGIFSRLLEGNAIVGPAIKQMLLHVYGWVLLLMSVLQALAIFLGRFL